MSEKDNRLPFKRRGEIIPEELLERCLELVSDIEAITIAIKWKDKTYTAGWTSQKNNDLALMVAYMQKQFTDTLVDE